MSDTFDFKRQCTKRELDRYKLVLKTFENHDGNIAVVASHLGMSVRDTKKLAKRLMPQSYIQFFDDNCPESMSKQCYETLMRNNYDLKYACDDIGMSEREFLLALRIHDKYDKIREKYSNISRTLIMKVMGVFLKSNRSILRTAKALDISVNDIREIRACFFPHIPTKRHIPSKENFSHTELDLKQLFEGFEGNYDLIAKFLGIDKIHAKYYIAKNYPNIHRTYLALFEEEKVS